MSKTGLPFENLIVRADSDLLQNMLSKPAVRLLRVLNGRDTSAALLRETLLALRSPQDLLEDLEVRGLLFELLRPREAKTLSDLLSLKGEPFQALESFRMRRGSRVHHTLLSFFGLAPDVREVAVALQVKTETNPAYGLFHHQREVVRTLRDYLSQPDGRVLLHMPTAAGKTRTAMNVVSEHLRRNEPTVVLWLATSEELCEQAATEFKNAWGHLGNRQLDVYRCWGSLEPDFSEISDGCIVASLQKLYAMGKKQLDCIAQLGDMTSFIVFDEAHQSIAKTYRLVIDGVFSRRPERSCFLGLTATPGRSWQDISEDLKLSKYFDQNKVSLKIPGYDSPIEYLFDEGYLARPHFISVDWQGSITDAERRRIANALEVPRDILRKLAEDELRNIQIVQNVETYCQKHARILLFAATVDHAKLLASVLQARGIEAHAIAGDTPPNERRRWIEWYKEHTQDPRVLVNFGVLTTGFDAPQTSCAIISRPTKSLVLYSQMVGRATRGVRAGGNRFADIVTVVDTDLPGFRSLTESFLNWEDVWRTQPK